MNKRYIHFTWGCFFLKMDGINTYYARALRIPKFIPLMSNKNLIDIFIKRFKNFVCRLSINIIEITESGHIRFKVENETMETG